VEPVKFFIDSARIEEVRQAVDLGVCDGVTTNPTLMAQTGRRVEDVIRDLLEVVPGPISLEAVSEDADRLVEEARRLSALDPQKVVVKIPMTREGLVAVRRCAQQGIRTNVTLVFSATQALLAAKAGATYVSPFIGRLDDVSCDGMDLIADILQIYDHYDFSTEVIVASVRHPMHVLRAALLGADIATIPFAVMLKLFDHPLTDVGVQRFLEDHRKASGRG
jgi:transaldolase